MRFKQFLTDGKIALFPNMKKQKNNKKNCLPGFFYNDGKCVPYQQDSIELTKQHTSLLEYVDKQGAKDFINRWKNKLKSYGLTEAEFSDHFIIDRLNHKRNNPPITTDELDFLMNGFIKKMGSQFKKDIENVKNHTAKKRGFNKKELNDNEIEYTVSSNSNNINFAFVLKQNFKKKGTAVIVPITILRKKKFRLLKGEQVIVERREL